MKEIVIPAGRGELIDWAVEYADTDTVIIVPNWTVKGLILLAADSRDKFINVEINRAS